jgi:hypothetical protein
VTSSLLGPSISLNLVLKTSSVYALRLVLRDQVSHPYKTTGRIMVLYILTFTFLDSRQDDKRLNRMVVGIPHNLLFKLFIHAVFIC